LEASLSYCGRCNQTNGCQQNRSATQFVPASQFATSDLDLLLMSIVRFSCPLFNEFATSACVSEIRALPKAESW